MFQGCEGNKIVVYDREIEMNLTNKTKILLATLIFLTILYEIYFVGVTFMAPVISGQMNPITQLAEASNLYNEPDIESIIPEILITSPVPNSRYSIKDELSIDFSVTDTSFLPEADIDGRKVANGEIFKCSELAIGKHTITVKTVANPAQDILLGALPSPSTSKEVTFTVVPSVSIKDLIGGKEGFAKFYIEGLGVENIYDKNIELIYHDKVNDTEVGLNSETGSSSIGDSDTDTIPELRVNFNKKWLKDILDANPYAEFTLTLELNDASSLNISSSDWESQDPSQLLVVGLKDGVAAISSIDVTGVATGEVSIRLKDELGSVITQEPLGIATNLSGNIWVSFSDKRIRMYNSCGEIQNISGTDWFLTVSSTPDGLDYDGANLRYCSSGTNKLYQISSSGAETDLGVVKRRLSLDGVATDSLSVNYTTQEYEGYNPKAISGTYLSSANLGKISKRDLSIGADFIQTLPSGSPIWTNEQDTPGSCLGVTQTPDYSVPEGHVVYLSCADGNIYKVRFVDKTALYATTSMWYIRKTQIGSSLPYYVPVGHPLGSSGRENFVDGNNIASHTERTYGKVTPISPFIEAVVVHRSVFFRYQSKWLGTQLGFRWVFNPSPFAPTKFSICSYNESWSLEQQFNNPIIGNSLRTYTYDGTVGIVVDHSPVVRVTNVTNIMPGTTFYYTGRYGNEGQTFPEVGPAPIPDPIPYGYISSAGCRYMVFSPDVWAFLTDNGSLTVLDQFTTSIPVPQGLAMGRLEPCVKEFLIRDKANFWNLIKHIPAENRYTDHKQDVSGEKVHVIVASDTAGQAKVNLEIVTDPVGVEDKMAWRASSQNVYPESGSFNTDGKSEATISSSGIGQETYEFYVGFDTNRNGLLDVGEETRSVNKVLLLTKIHVRDNFDIMLLSARAADLSRLLDISSTNLLIFLGKPDEANISSEIKPSTINRMAPVPNLELELEPAHPVGADFSQTTGIANIDERKFAPDSETAIKIGDSEALLEKVNEDLSTHKDEILQFFAQPNSPDNKVFHFPQPKDSVTFSEIGDMDLALGFHVAVISYDLDVKVRRDKYGQLSIPELSVKNGELTDLYDFDFYTLDGRQGATIQFAWRSPPSSNAGRIYKVFVKFKGRFENFPFP